MNFTISVENWDQGDYFLYHFISWEAVVSSLDVTWDLSALTVSSCSLFRTGYIKALDHTAVYNSHIYSTVLRGVYLPLTATKHLLTLLILLINRWLIETEVLFHTHSSSWMQMCVKIRWTKWPEQNNCDVNVSWSNLTVYDH